jgi:hypothetical protein
METAGATAATGMLASEEKSKTLQETLALDCGLLPSRMVQEEISGILNHWSGSHSLQQPWEMKTLTLPASLAAMAQTRDSAPPVRRPFLD